MGKKKSPKAKPPARPANLPVCIAMLLCDRLIISIDQTASIIRIVDTVGIPPDKDRKEGDLIEFPEITLFMAVKKLGDEKADFLVHSVDPQGTRTLIGSNAGGPEKSVQGGTNMVGRPRLRWSGEGLYWFELSTGDGSVIGKTPVQLTVGETAELQKKVAEIQSK